MNLPETVQIQFQPVGKSDGGLGWNDPVVISGDHQDRQGELIQPVGQVADLTGGRKVP